MLKEYITGLSQRLGLIIVVLVAAYFLFGAAPAAAQDIPANTAVDIAVQYNYDTVGTPILAVSGSSIWNSNQFSYNGYTTGNVFTQSNYLFFPNESRVGIGEFLYAAAGAVALPTATLDSTLYTLHLTTLNNTDVYTITHSFEFNEGITRVKVRTGRIVDNTATDGELPFNFQTALNIYPNPVINDMATIKFNSVVNGRADIYVYDVTGRQIVRKNVNVLPGTNEIHLGSNDMATGLNLVRVVAHDQVIANGNFIK